MAIPPCIPQAPPRCFLPNKFDMDGVFLLGVAGAPANSGLPTTAGGICKISRTSAGLFVLQLSYGVPAGYVVTQVAVTTRIAAIVAAKARAWQLQSVANQAAATPTITIQGVNAADAAADPEDNATLLVTVTCQLNI